MSSRILRAPATGAYNVSRLNSNPDSCSSPVASHLALKLYRWLSTNAIRLLLMASAYSYDIYASLKFLGSMMSCAVFSGVGKAGFPRQQQLGRKISALQRIRGCYRFRRLPRWMPVSIDRLRAIELLDIPTKFPGRDRSESFIDITVFDMYMKAKPASPHSVFGRFSLNMRTLAFVQCSFTRRSATPLLYGTLCELRVIPKRTQELSVVLEKLHIGLSCERVPEIASGSLFLLFRRAWYAFDGLWCLYREVRKFCIHLTQLVIPFSVLVIRRVMPSEAFGCGRYPRYIRSCRCFMKIDCVKAFLACLSENYVITALVDQKCLITFVTEEIDTKC
eukprot:IDg13233t1